VAPLPSLVELAAPLLRGQGHFIAWKGDLAEGELERARHVGEIVGLVEVSRRGFVLPERHEARTIVTYRRDRAPSIVLPRRVGLAQRRPLA